MKTWTDLKFSFQSFSPIDDFKLQHKVGRGTWQGKIWCGPAVNNICSWMKYYDTDNICYFKKYDTDLKIIYVYFFLQQVHFIKINGPFCLSLFFLFFLNDRSIWVTPGGVALAGAGVVQERDLYLIMFWLRLFYTVQYSTVRYCTHHPQTYKGYGC